MEFSLSLDRCSNSSCMRCNLDLYIHLSNDRGRRFFYLLTWMVWRKSKSLWCCCNPSIVLGSVISLGFHWPDVVYRWLLWLGPGPKTFQQRHHPHSLEVVQIIFHHCISPRCSSHMLSDIGIGWWRILMTMAHMSFAYTIHFWDPRRWQKVNVIGILFL